MQYVLSTDGHFSAYSFDLSLSLDSALPKGRQVMYTTSLKGSIFGVWIMFDRLRKTGQVKVLAGVLRGMVYSIKPLLFEFEEKI